MTATATTVADDHSESPESDHVLYEGLSNDEIQDLKAARERQRRVFEQQQQQQQTEYQQSAKVKTGVEKAPTPPVVPANTVRTVSTTTSDREAALMRRIVLLEKMLLESEEEKVQLRLKLVRTYVSLIVQQCSFVTNDVYLPSMATLPVNIVKAEVLAAIKD